MVDSFIVTWLNWNMLKTEDTQVLSLMMPPQETESQGIWLSEWLNPQMKLKSKYSVCNGGGGQFGEMLLIGNIRKYC